MGRAAEVVAARARVYLKSDKYISVQIFLSDKDGTTEDLLTRCFGGNCYKHLAGRYWMLSKRAELKRLVDDLGEHTDPKGAVRTKILKYLPEELKG